MDPEKGLNLEISFPKTRLASSHRSLIIQSDSNDCTRLTIYPIKDKPLIKITLSGPKVSDRIIQDLSKILQQFNVIHTSGLLIKGEQLHYEVYINISFDDREYKELINNLDKIHNIFKLITIEEIQVVED